MELAAAGEPAVVLTVVAVRGSAPREPGARMLVTGSATIGTIGGGQLEHECTRLAVERLARDDAADVRRFPLGAAMGQCCGGVVDVMFETVAGAVPAWLSTLDELRTQRTPAVLVTAPESAGSLRLVVTADRVFGAAEARVIETARDLLLRRDKPAYIDGVYYEPLPGSDFDIAVFGAGHVGSALVTILATLDCSVRWIDSRREVFGHVPKNANAIEAPDPTLEVAALAKQSCVVVVTHSHALDFAICCRALGRSDLAYVGLIGSATKRRRFVNRFSEHGLTAREIDRLTCPIGAGSATGKKPAEIAVAVAAELLQQRSATIAHDLPDNVRRLRE